MVSSLYQSLVSRSPFGWPILHSPQSQGLAIEDNQSNLYFGAERIPEMKRKIKELPWAKNTLRLWQEEAESVLSEKVDFGTQVKTPWGGGLAHDDGVYLIFDPSQKDLLYHPVKGEWLKMNKKYLASWVSHSHERYHRLMSGLSILYALTDDARYSKWVWDAFRDALRYYRLCEDEKFSIGYEMPLFEARTQRHLVQSMELVQNGPGKTKEDRQAIDSVIFERAGNMLSRWLDVMLPHNMVSWGGGALAVMGRLMKRKDWIDKAVHDKKTGIQNHISHGVPRDPKTGKIDGIWFETSTHYNFFAFIPLIGLYRVAEQEGAVNEDVRERFTIMFEAPFNLIDPELRFVSIGERMAVGAYQLTLMHHVYEYAAGQVNAERYAPILSTLYNKLGIGRTSIASLAYGPDELPPPGKLPKTSVVMPAAKMATFRGETPQGSMTCWFLSGESNSSGQAHQNHDKLSISLHAHGEIVASDLGLSTHREDNLYGTYLNGTFSHNTLIVNEKDQGPLESLSFETNLNAKVPWAHGKLRGDRTNTARERLWKVMLKRKDDVAEGIYDDATLERTIYFDPPYIILVDGAEASSQKRFGFTFHSLGSLLVNPDLADKNTPLSLPVLPDTGPLSLFTNKTTVSPVKRVVADWRIKAHLWLRLIVVPEVPGEITWGRTPYNPSFDSRGTILLRTPGTRARFTTAIEIHTGNPTLSNVIPVSENSAEILLSDNQKRSYSR